MTLIKIFLAGVVAVAIISVPVIGIALVLLDTMFHLTISAPAAYAIIALALVEMAGILIYAVVQSRQDESTGRHAD